MKALLLIVPLALTACHTIRTTDFIATPADRLVCEAAGPRPTIPAEYVVDWSAAEKAKDVPTAITIAQGEVSKLLASVHNREGITVAYILAIEGKLYTCSANMQWRRDYETELAKSHAAIQP